MVVAPEPLAVLLTVTAADPPPRSATAAAAGADSGAGGGGGGGGLSGLATGTVIGVVRFQVVRPLHASG